MVDHRCPGQNTQFWGPNDIFSLPCPACKTKIEFFKDDAKRKCLSCGRTVYNPRVNQGCALWCPKAEDCLGPDQYKSLQETARLAQQRKEDIEKLISSVEDKDEDVKKLFKKLYIENSNPARLIDTDQLNKLRETDPSLFERAIRYFSQFTEKK